MINVVLFEPEIPTNCGELMSIHRGLQNSQFASYQTVIADYRLAGVRLYFFRADSGSDWEFFADPTFPFCDSFIGAQQAFADLGCSSWNCPVDSDCFWKTSTVEEHFRTVQARFSAFE